MLESIQVALHFALTTKQTESNFFVFVVENDVVI